MHRFWTTLYAIVLFGSLFSLLFWWGSAVQILKLQGMLSLIFSTNFLHIMLNLLAVMVCTYGLYVGNQKEV